MGHMPISRSKKIDRLFSEFVQELNGFSTNGVVRHMDLPKVFEMMEHFGQQCDNYLDREELQSRIRLFIDSKVKYSATEAELCLSEAIENTIREKIAEVMKKNFGDALKYAGFLLNWTVIRPAKFFKAFMEPIVTNTVLTYSIAVQPLTTDPVSFARHVYQTVNKPQPKIAVVKKELPDSYAALVSVKPYTEADLDYLTNAFKNESLTQRVIRGQVLNIVDKADNKDDVFVKAVAGLEVDLDRRIFQQRYVTIPKYRGTASTAAPAVKPVVKLRDMKEIQRVIAQYDSRIQNCFRGMIVTETPLNMKVSVKFTIAPGGYTKNVQFISLVHDDLARRIQMQLLQMKFSEVDAKLGEQAIYHTFYF